MQCELRCLNVCLLVSVPGKYMCSLLQALHRPRPRRQESQEQVAPAQICAWGRVQGVQAVRGPGQGRCGFRLFTEIALRQAWV